MRTTKLFILAVLTLSLVGLWPPPASAHIRHYPHKLWQRLGDCESGDWDRHGHPMPYTARWHDQRAPYEGGIHFAPVSWDRAVKLTQQVHPSHRYPAAAYLASGGAQIEVAEVWLAHTSWRQWPTCSRKLGLR